MKNGRQFFIKCLFCFTAALMFTEVLAQVVVETDREGRGIFLPPGNKPPSAFNLISPDNGAQLILDAMFLWEESVDPEGGLITYTFIINDAQGTTVHQQTLTEPFAIVGLFVVTSLQTNTPYFWQVIATDPQGASTPSNQTYTFLISQTGGNTTLHVYVTSQQSSALLESAQVIAQIQGSSDSILFPGTFDCIQVGIAAAGDTIDITASEVNHSSNTLSNYIVPSSLPPVKVDIQLSCSSCNAVTTCNDIFKDQLESP